MKTIQFLLNDAHDDKKYDVLQAYNNQCGNSSITFCFVYEDKLDVAQD
jgi:hypothetical protein